MPICFLWYKNAVCALEEYLVTWLVLTWYNCVLNILCIIRIMYCRTHLDALVSITAGQQTYWVNMWLCHAINLPCNGKWVSRFLYKLRNIHLQMLNSILMLYCFINQCLSRNKYFLIHLLTSTTVNLIHFSHLPLWIDVFLQGALVGARQYYQAAILLVYFLHCCPCTHNTISWPEWEVVQVLVQGVARSLLSWDTKCTALNAFSETTYCSCACYALAVHVSLPVYYLYQGVCWLAWCA